jgi:serine/threonine protein kinase
MWSLGVMFYEMIYGICPFEAKNMFDLTDKLKKEPIRFHPQIPIT